MPPDRPLQRFSAAMLRMASDERLAQQVAVGSEAAFAAIFDRHHRPLLAFCRHMLGSREDAEDAVQHTFLAAYRRLVHGEETAALRPWLYTVARHHCLSLLRARRQQRIEANGPAGGPLATDLDAREDLRAIVRDMARLPDDQRDALVLAELGDVSHDEIAAILGCPREKVKALVFQARSSLAASRTARETPCAEIREQLATLRGGALRRATLHRHVDDCAGCRAFRDQLRLQRRALGALLPVAPVPGLRGAVLGTLFGSGGSGAAAGGALGTGALAATALVAIAIPGAGLVARGVDARGSRGGAVRAAATATPARLHPATASASGLAQRRIAERARSERRSGSGPGSAAAHRTAELARPAPSEPPKRGTDEAPRAASPEVGRVASPARAASPQPAGPPPPPSAAPQPAGPPPPSAVTRPRGKAQPPPPRRPPRTAAKPAQRPAQPVRSPQTGVPAPVGGPDKTPPPAPAPAPAPGPPSVPAGPPAGAGAERGTPQQGARGRQGRRDN